MNFNAHYDLAGKHAFLSPSNYHWVNYDVDKLRSRYDGYLAVERGTRLHALAKECISLGVKLPRSKKTLNLFVNDSIGFRMTPEQVLYYSPVCFGTADSIDFDRRANKLRIFDLKTGESKTSMLQLEIYAALFCLEYSYSPYDISIELRIYQYDDVVIEEADPDDINEIMDKIVSFSAILDELQSFH